MKKRLASSGRGNHSTTTPGNPGVSPCVVGGAGGGGRIFGERSDMLMWGGCWRKKQSPPLARARSTDKGRLWEEAAKAVFMAWELTLARFLVARWSHDETINAFGAIVARWSHGFFEVAQFALATSLFSGRCISVGSEWTSSLPRLKSRVQISSPAPRKYNGLCDFA